MITSHWKSFEEKVLSDTPAGVTRIARMAFYGGAWALLGLIEALNNDDTLTEDERDRMYQAAYRDCEAFAAAEGIKQAPAAVAVTRESGNMNVCIGVQGGKVVFQVHGQKFMSISLNPKDAREVAERMFKVSFDAEK